MLGSVDKKRDRGPSHPIKARGGPRGRGKAGMTIAELLVVVAILAILGGVAFIAVWNHQRSLAQLERDGIAKEIFIAAQNHLTAARGEGYLGKSGYGTAEAGSDAAGGDAAGSDAGDGAAGADAAADIYYYVVSRGTVTGGGDDAFGLMLPFGSIDETVRAGGSYLVRYQPGTARMLDVFYCSTSGSPDRFNHTLQTDEYRALVALIGQDHKSARRTWTDGSVLGWYGGEGAMELASLDLEAPAIRLVNAEKLYVAVDNTKNKGKSGAALSLIVTGVTSGAQKMFLLSGLPVLDGRVMEDSENPGFYDVILDDITGANLHFCDLVADSGAFLPGEDVRVQAVAYSNTALSNIAYSGQATDNSLFASVDAAAGGGAADDPAGNPADAGTGQAAIANIRHLENLDKAISNLGGTQDPLSVTPVGLSITSALQTDDLSWTAFTEAIAASPGADTSPDATSVQIYEKGGANATKAGCYHPVDTDSLAFYDGQGHSISHVAVERAGHAGVFGSFGSASSVDPYEIRNLELIDCEIRSTGAGGSGAGDAGTLAGALTNTTVANVLARMSRDAAGAGGTSGDSAAGDGSGGGGASSAASASVVSAAGAAGGLVGSMDKSQLQYCAAALLVKGYDAAGGLVGRATGDSSRISASYASGRTSEGRYGTDAYNVTATGPSGAAGGLAGSFTGTGIENSYATCSASGKGAAGGLAGALTDTSIHNAYATGLVRGGGDDGAANAGAFAGSLSGTVDMKACSYLEIVNEIVAAGSGDGPQTLSITYLGGIGGLAANPGGLAPFDGDAASFNDFSGEESDWQAADPYDSLLIRNYRGKYPYKTVGRLTDDGAGVGETEARLVDIHYGDWPAPEILFGNTKNP